MAGFAMTEQLRTVSRTGSTGSSAESMPMPLSAIREWLADYLGF